MLVLRSMRVPRLQSMIFLLMKNIPLKLFIIIPFAVLFVIAGVTSYSFSTLAISYTVDKVGEEHIQEVEKRMITYLKDYLKPLTSLVTINQRAFADGRLALNDLYPVANRFHDQALANSHLTFISVATTDGRYVASVQDPFTKEENITLSANFVEKPLSLAGYAFDPYKVIGKRESDHFSYDPRTRPFYIDAINKGGLVLSDIHTYHGYKTHGISLSAPIIDAKGNVLGVTAASIALNQLDEFLSSLDIVSGAIVYFADENGDVIATSVSTSLKTSKEGQPEDTVNGGLTRVSLANHEHPALKEASNGLNDNTSILTVGDTDYYFSVETIQLDNERTWSLGILIPKKYHLTTIDDFYLYTVISILFMLIVIIIIGTIISRNIAKPVQVLNDAIKSQDLKSVQLIQNPISNISELNSLSVEMKSMSRNLSDLVENLESKVAERTHHLASENNNLHEKAITDELTGLTNRRGFNRQMEDDIKLANQRCANLILVVCDIDYFKQINDKFGHDEGDRVLQDVAKLLEAKCGQSANAISRFGGEEFAIIYTDFDNDECIRTLSSIQDELKVLFANRVYDITLSFGVCEIYPTDNTSAKRVFKLADTKLYQAKRTGRNKIVYFGD